MFLSLFCVSPQAINVISQTEERKTIKVARNFSSFILFLEQKWAIWDATLSHLHRYLKCDSPSSWVSRLGVIELRSCTLGSFTVEGLEVASQQWGVCVCVFVCVWDALLQTLRKVNTEMSSEIVVARCWKEIMFLLKSVQPCFVYIVTISILNPKSKAWSVIHAVFFFSLHARLFACMWRTSDRTVPTLAVCVGRYVCCYTHITKILSFCRWGTTIVWVIYGRYFHLVQSLKRMVIANPPLVWSVINSWRSRLETLHLTGHKRKYGAKELHSSLWPS